MNNLVTFSVALTRLKEGRKIAREGWNGKGMWLMLITPHESQVMIDPDKGRTYKRMPYIGMKTADDCFVPWLASQTDILAEDWVIIE